MSDTTFYALMVTFVCLAIWYAIRIFARSIVKRLKGSPEPAAADA